MARPSHDPLWKKALAAAARNVKVVKADPTMNPPAVEPELSVEDVGGRLMVYDSIGNCLGEMVKDPNSFSPRLVNQQRELTEPEYYALQEWLNNNTDRLSSKPAKSPRPKDEGEKPPVSDDCEECTMPLEFCHCKDMASPRASVEDDVLITEPSTPGVSDMDYPNEMDEGK